MKYYTLLLISIFFLILSFLFFKNSQENIKNLDITKIINFEKIDFAWEKVSFEWKNYFNREKFERELSIVRFNVYQTILYHKRESIYFPIIEKKLRLAWIPEDFKYLAVAESALKNDALSDANAGWIWQFIPETAKRFGLKIDQQIDERYNFEKATDAAILYFKKLYKDFGNRSLVAAAYNRWENWLRRALDDQRVNSYYDLYLNEETSRYVWRILAIKYVMLNRYKIFEKEELWEQFLEPKIKEIEITWPINLKDWTNKNWQTYASIKLLNQWIIEDKLPKWNWKIKVLDY